MIKKPIDDDEANKGWMPLGSLERGLLGREGFGSFGSRVGGQQAPCARKPLGSLHVALDAQEPPLGYHCEVYRPLYHDACREILSLAFTKCKEPLVSHVSYESGAFQFFADYYLQERPLSCHMHL